MQRRWRPAVGLSAASHRLNIAHTLSTLHPAITNLLAAWPLASISSR